MKRRRGKNELSLRTRFSLLGNKREHTSLISYPSQEHYVSSSYSYRLCIYLLPPAPAKKIMEIHIRYPKKATLFAVSYKIVRRVIHLIKSYFSIDYTTKSRYSNTHNKTRGGSCDILQNNSALKHLSFSSRKK